MLLGAARRTPFRANSGMARKSPRNGRTILATIVKKATKGKRINPSVRKDIFSAAHFIWFMMDSFIINPAAVSPQGFFGCMVTYMMGTKCVNAIPMSELLLSLLSFRWASLSPFVKKGINQGRRPELIGGGLVRSAGGWQAVQALRQAGIHQKSDERI